MAVINSPERNWQNAPLCIGQSEIFQFVRIWAESYFVFRSDFYPNTPPKDVLIQSDFFKV